uniref:Uncharacterized protein n=1 Tax=Dunaliella tertiolecta TaxID=3047 RepID=A0A7S3VU75_DUNTE|mmetsp:Transcript_1103/g.2580  ORF Transcript_1103/g.2580 Transcript_1103/m.2580 type:complete len:374 (+) Transcript_1103:77-1198(+)|eukprot:CAMPEP_0202350412 /NCGR_PEP_ID=MMETSP1126-20121109/7497_1 /ASSEMBLY_ACC=CAM_ASM_000457 /TAXON_ID=3047 /ORGANISM="Dunaliella tertiolecta, Strain CCMP1320" /LENGTH=373 /DNA_ID=CAMNT_0048942383 /DNA_START=102 /DNA_END=1223 /DNA_ORIENTATION=-
MQYSQWGTRNAARGLNCSNSKRGITCNSSYISRPGVCCSRIQSPLVSSGLASNCSRHHSQHHTSLQAACAGHTGRRRQGCVVQSSDKPEQLDLQKKDPSFTGLAAWVGGAAAFGAGIWYFMGRQKAEEFFAGYLLEQSLSVDNLFVFLLVFGYFKTPEAAQGKVLQYGILSAAVLRAVFILGGVELIKTFEPALGVFAGILIFSSVKLLTKTEDEDADEDLADNSLVQLCRRFIKTGDDYDGDNFFTVLKDGTKVATPLLLALAVIELSDVVFAVDSIPAVFGVTLDPFIIYTSNMFAIFSLRALYGFVSTVMTELRFLDKAVALVLGFIGVKMLLGFADVEVPTDLSLLVVGVVLGGGVGASLLLPEPKKAD